MQAFLRQLIELCLLKTAVDLLLPESPLRRLANLAMGLLITARMLLALKALLGGAL